MRWRMLGRWVLALGIFALVFVLGDVRELGHFRILWGYVFGILFSTLTFILFHTLRWKKIVDALSEKKGTRVFPFFNWMIHSYALAYVIPRDVSLLSVRSYYLTKHRNLSLPLSLFSVTVDRLLDMGVFLVVVMPSLLFVLKILSPTESLMAMVLCLGGFLFIIRWKGEGSFRLLLRVYRKMLTLPILRNRVAVRGDDPPPEYSLGEKGFFSICLWTIGAYLLLVSRLFFTGQALDVPLTFLQSLFIIPVIQVAGLVSITPGGLGILELGSWGALLLIGIPKDQILRFVVGQRILLTAVMLLLIVINTMLSFIEDKRGGAGKG